jgi:hypothetical protein
MTDTMTERPDRCTMIGRPWSFDLAGYFVDFVRNDGHWGIRPMLRGSTMRRSGERIERAQ